MSDRRAARSRRLLSTALALAVLVFVAVLVLASFGDRIYPRLIESAAGVVGLSLSARGPVEVQFWPALTLTAHELDVSRSQDGAFDAQLGQLRLVLDPGAGLAGKPLVEAVELHDARVRIDPSGPGLPSIAADGLRVLARARVRIENVRLEIGAAGAPGRHELRIGRYTSGPGPTGPPRIEVRGSFDGDPFSVQGEVGTTVQPVAGGAAFPLNATVSMPAWKIEGMVRGHVRDPLAGKGLSLEAEAHVPDASPLLALLGVEGLPAGPVRARAVLEGDLPLLRLSRLDATLVHGDDVVATVEGHGIDPSDARIDSLRVTYRGPMPESASGWAGGLQSMDADASVTGKSGSYRVDIAHLRAGLADAALIEASGVVEVPALDDWAAARVDVRLGLDARHPGALAAYLGGGLARLTPWKGQGRLILSPSGWRMSDVKVHAGEDGDARLDVTGELRGPGGLGGFVDRLIAGAADPRDTASLDATLDTAHPSGTAWLLGLHAPALGALQGRAHLESRSGEVAVTEIDAHSSGPLAITLTGAVGELRSWRDLDLKLRIRPMTPEAMSRLLGFAAPLQGAVSLDTTLRSAAGQSLSVDGELKVGGSRFELVLAAEHAVAVPLLKGRIHAARVDAKDFWQPGSTPPPDATAPDAKASATTPAASTPESRAVGPTDGFGLLSMIPGLGIVLRGELESPAPPTPAATVPPRPPAGDPQLPWRWLRRLDLDLDLVIDAMHGTRFSEGSMDLKLVNRGGRLELGPATLVLGQSQVTLRGVADASSSAAPPSLELEGEGHGIPIRALMGPDDPDADGLSGLLDFAYDLRSSGQTLEALRGGLGGEIRTLLEDARLPIQDLDLLSGDVVRWLLTWIGSDNHVPVTCAVAILPIEDGIARVKTLYVKTERSAAAGIGTINLREGTVDLTIQPVVSWLSLSPPASVRIRGSFESPELASVDASGVLMFYGVEAMTDILFPPNLLIGPLWRRIAGPSEGSTPGPCQQEAKP